jgi:hypothetical protein
VRRLAHAAGHLRLQQLVGETTLRMAAVFYRAVRDAARHEVPLLAAGHTTAVQVAKALADRLAAEHQLTYVIIGRFGYLAVRNSPDPRDYGSRIIGLCGWPGAPEDLPMTTTTVSVLPMSSSAVAGRGQQQPGCLRRSTLHRA